MKRTGNLGPYLDPRKVSSDQVPDQFGPGLLHKVVRESVQKLVDVSLDQKAVFGMLRQGEGKVIITASFEEKIQKVRLPAMNNEEAVKDFFEILFEELRCEPFYQVFDIYDPEDEPLKNGVKRKSNEVTLTFSNSGSSSTGGMPTLTANVDPGPSTPKIPRLSSIDPASFYNGKSKNKGSNSHSRGRGRPPGAKNKVPPEAKANKSPKTSGSSPFMAASSPTKSVKTGPIYQNAHKLHLAQEKAKALAAAAASFANNGSSTITSSAASHTPANNGRLHSHHDEMLLQTPPKLEPEELPKDPTLWTIDNVICHLGRLDGSLRPHVEMFRSHEIDGNALLLLTSDVMMKYMGMKLGPALKICNIIAMIKGEKHQPIPK